MSPSRKRSASEHSADLNTGTLEISYRAEHPELVVTGGTFDPTEVELLLPPSHLEALLYFVAARVSQPVGMSPQDQTSNTYYAKYEAVCQELENKGLYIDQGADLDRLRDRGFV